MKFTIFELMQPSTSDPITFCLTLTLLPFLNQCSLCLKFNSISHSLCKSTIWRVMIPYLGFSTFPSYFVNSYVLLSYFLITVFRVYILFFYFVFSALYMITFLFSQSTLLPGLLFATIVQWIFWDLFREFGMAFVAGIFCCSSLYLGHFLHNHYTWKWFWGRQLTILYCRKIESAKSIHFVALC